MKKRSYKVAIAAAMVAAALIAYAQAPRPSAPVQKFGVQVQSGPMDSILSEGLRTGVIAYCSADQRTEGEIPGNRRSCAQRTERCPRAG